MLADPHVPEGKRFCGAPGCGEPVGRAKDGRPGRTEGFCATCGHPYSFSPKLAAGDLVHGQYEVVGCLAHGGLGWVYLARDLSVEGRPVVLKGLLNTGDADAQATVDDELRFLAEVNHPSIVGVINFTEHAGERYIVMEHVSGKTLKEVRDEYRETKELVPPSHAIAYMLEALSALGYLHRRGLVYCDFKPDNVMLTGDSIKIIDLGAVQRIGEWDGIGVGHARVPGARGRRLRPLGRLRPVHRRAHARRAVHPVPRLHQHLRIRSPDPRRGATVRDPRQPVPVPAPSDGPGAGRAVPVRRGDGGPARRSAARDRGRRAGRHRTRAERVVHRRAPHRGRCVRLGALPLPFVAADDPAAGFLAAISANDIDEVLALLELAPEHTVEVDLRAVRELLEADRVADARDVLDAIGGDAQQSWRVAWHRGLCATVGRDPATAIDAFTLVHHQLPGELAPKLGLGMATEAASDRTAAEHWYDVVSRTDDTFTSAAFGLARCRLARRDRAGAVAAYERVPRSSSAAIEALVAKAEAMLDDTETELTVDDVLGAAAVLDGLNLRGEPRAQLTVRILHGALAVAPTSNGAVGAVPTVLGHELTDDGIRTGLERTYRELANYAAEPAERIRLVDEANRLRPRTLT